MHEDEQPAEPTQGQPPRPAAQSVDPWLIRPHQVGYTRGDERDDDVDPSQRLGIQVHCKDHLRKATTSHGDRPRGSPHNANLECRRSASRRRSNVTLDSKLKPARGPKAVSQPSPLPHTAIVAAEAMLPRAYAQ